MFSKEELAHALADLEDERALEIVQTSLTAGVPPVELLEACQDGMGIVSERYDEGEYFISDLVISGDIFNEIATILAPSMQGSDGPEAGPKVVFGTIQGDLHNLGKDIVINMLTASGFDVIDLGVDVAPEDFVAAVREHQSSIVGMSALLTVGFAALQKTVDLLRDEGLRDQVKVMIGGGAVDASTCEIVGADAWTREAQMGVQFAKEWSK